jgi:cob(I)alamin adenosyltransferase
MKIYTKTGDKGSTSLLGGTRVSKAHLRIDSYGTVDELNAWIGMLRDQEVNQSRVALLLNIQDRLFTIGSELAAEPGKAGQYNIPKIEEQDIIQLEEAIDEMNTHLEPMKTFILPGGHPSISYAHVARTVCRRAERTIVLLSQEEPTDELIVKYLNRLSDYLFVLSRKIGKELSVSDTPWIAKRKSE